MLTRENNYVAVDHGSLIRIKEPWPRYFCERFTDTLYIYVYTTEQKTMSHFVG